jgi:serine/threonine protein kinase/Flp pilus assembly protein TadD
MNEPSAAPNNSLEDVLGELAEEFTQRLKRGEQPQIEEYVQRFPAAADLIRQVFPALQALDQVALDEPAPGVDGSPHSPPGLLGDFRLVREIGRGGMGVVYEAEQVSLGRRVALKVLPLAATLDPRRLQRFQNEARAAAGLHHTNIVPVFAVGAEHGVHFYAMQLIAGQTLAAVLGELRRQSQGQKHDKAPAREEQPGEATTAYPPAPGDGAAASTAPQGALSTESGIRNGEYIRAVARLGVQAAEALDYAHQLGVVHRDIKPGNLMVDARGQLWVTDFGLAQFHREGADSLTLSGDLVGTLRYMSPEQALAKRMPVDHRTDLYSLGVTLYELLTLEPAFEGTDRQDVLRQIAFEEPRRPRRLNRAVPAELETIVLKAMEKSPADRYATAQELADDLERFLKHEPIRARRPSVLQRTRKWARRHRPVVWAAAIVLLVTAVLSGSAGLWWVQRRAESEAEARAAFDEAKRWQQQEKWSEALSAIRRAQGVLTGFGGDADLQRQLNQRRKEVEMAVRLDDARLATTALHDEAPHWEAGNAAYGEAFKWYGLDVDNADLSVRGERLHSCSIRMQLAAALDDWAWLRLNLKITGTRKLLALACVVDPNPWRNRVRESLAAKDFKSLEKLLASAKNNDLSPPSAVLLARITQRTAAAEQSLLMLRRAQKCHPGDFWLNHYLGACLQELQPPRAEEAIRYYSAAIALRPSTPGAHMNLGCALRLAGQLEEAIVEYREAVRLKKDYAWAHVNLGIGLAEKGELDEAIAEYREAIRLRKDLSAAHTNLGIALARKGRLVEAIAAHRESIHLKKDFAEAHCNLGAAFAEKGELDEAIAEFRQAIGLKKDFPMAHYSLGNTLYLKGRLDDAIAEFREAVRIKNDFAWAHCNLGNALFDKGQLNEAVAEFHKALRLKKDLEQAHYNLGRVLYSKGQREDALAEFREAIRCNKDYDPAHHAVGMLLRDKGNLEGAVAALREAIRINPKLPEAHCNLAHILRDRGHFTEALTLMRRGHKLGSRKPGGWPYPSALWVKQCEHFVELEAKLPNILKGELKPVDPGERLMLAQICQRPGKSLNMAAFRFYADAFADQPQLAENPLSPHRYNAACAAALAGCGRGKDADKLDTKERAHLRQQGLKWLQADLEAQRKLLGQAPDLARPMIAKQMQHWLQDPDFAGVRGAESLAKLPEAEGQQWQQLWQEVEALRQSTDKLTKKPGQ